MVQPRSPEAQYQLSQRACGGIHCFIMDVAARKLKMLEGVLLNNVAVKSALDLDETFCQFCKNASLT